MVFALAYIVFCAFLGYVGGVKTFLVFFGLPVILLCAVAAYDFFFVLPEAEPGSGAGIGLGLLLGFSAMLFGGALFLFVLFMLIGKLVRSYSESRPDP